MTAYPKLDHEVEIVTTGDFRIKGSINVLGRNISTYLQGNEPDIVIYNCTIDQTQHAETLMISKHQIVTVATGEQSPTEERIGTWKRVALTMSNGNIITGDVNITGYDRLSDFMQYFTDQFFELHNVEMDDLRYDIFYVSRIATLWKEPASS